jgi:hypothetical protein
MRQLANFRTARGSRRRFDGNTLAVVEQSHTTTWSLIHSSSVYRKPFYWGAFQLYAGS